MIDIKYLYLSISSRPPNFVATTYIRTFEVGSAVLEIRVCSNSFSDSFLYYRLLYLHKQYIVPYFLNKLSSTITSDIRR